MTRLKSVVLHSNMVIGGKSMAIHVDECLPMASIHENIIEANGGFPLPVHIEHPSRNHGGSRGLKPYSWDHTMQGVEH